MQTIKRKNEKTYEVSTYVRNGIAIFPIPVVKTVYKDSAEFTTHNSKFVYSFSDCEVMNGLLQVKIQKEEKKIGKIQLFSPANNIKVYLSIKYAEDK